MHRPVVSVLLLMLALSTAAGAQTVYKCVGESGTVYSEKPCGPAAEVRTANLRPTWQTVPGRATEHAVGDVASVRDGEGHTLAVYREQSGAVWMRFSLPATTTHALDRAFTPAFAVDGGAPTSLESTRNMERTAYVVGYRDSPTSVSYLIWHGIEAQGRSTKLKQLMAAQTSYDFHHRTADGVDRVARFTVSGASPAIARALGISEAVDVAGEARIADYKQVMIAASRQCLVRPDPQACIERGRSCSEQHSGDAEAFTACFER